MLKLTELINTSATREGVFVPFSLEGVETSFEVQIVYYGKDAMTKLAEACTKKEFDTTTLQEKDVFDRAAFRREYSRRVIKGWKGLTVEVLTKLIPIDASKVAEIPVDHQFPCNDEYKEFLIAQSVIFDTWLTRACTSLDTFNAKKKADEEKN